MVRSEMGMNAIHDRYVASISAPTMSADPITGHRYQGWKPCMDWCEERWGDRGGWWYIGEGVFEFNDERDYLMFLLRWAA
jgi:hypothetical protein